MLQQHVILNSYSFVYLMSNHYISYLNILLISYLCILRNILICIILKICPTCTISLSSRFRQLQANMSSNTLLQISKLYLSFEGKYHHLVDLVGPFRNLVADLPPTHSIKEKTEGTVLQCIPFFFIWPFHAADHLSSEMYFILMKHTLLSEHGYVLPGNVKLPLYEFNFIIQCVSTR